MKMPTLLAAANQKLSAFVCRRAFSERSRWLAVGLPDGSLDFPICKRRFSAQRLLIPFADTKAYLMHPLHAQAMPVRE